MTFTDASLQVIDLLCDDNYENFRNFLEKLSPSESDWVSLKEETLSKVGQIFLSFVMWMRYGLVFWKYKYYFATLVRLPV